MSAAPQLRNPADAYDAIKALNWSTLKHLAVSPKLLEYRTEHDRPDTAALKRGRAIHCAVFEPERWRRDYVAQPDFGPLSTNTARAKRAAWLAKLSREKYVPRPYFDMRTKVGKADRAAFIASLPADAKVLVGDEKEETLDLDVTILSADEHALAERCARAVREHPRAAALLRGGRAEETIEWEDPVTGLPCKARLDFVTPRYVLDLKSTRRKTLRLMGRDNAEFMNHGQLAWYFDGAVAAKALPYDAELPRGIMVQTVEPFDVVAFQMEPDQLAAGRELYRSLLTEYARCKAAGWFPGLAEDVVRMPLAAWASTGSNDDEDGEDW